MLKMMTLGLCLVAGSAQANVMTFTGIPWAGGLPDNTWIEDGITAQGSGWLSAGGDSAHLDDFGTSYANAIGFTTGGIFDAVSFDVLGDLGGFYYSLTTWNYETDLPETIYPTWDNVEVWGSKGNSLTGHDTFTMGSVSTYLFPDTFKGIDSLVISIIYPPAVPEGWTAWCPEPCSHFSIDNVTLNPAAVPLPAGLPLLATALGGLWFIRRRGAAPARETE